MRARHVFTGSQRGRDPQQSRGMGCARSHAWSRAGDVQDGGPGGEGTESQPLGTVSIPAWRLSVFGPSISSTKQLKCLLLITTQGSCHHLTSPTRVASSETCLLAPPWAPAMSLAGRSTVRSFTGASTKLHFIFMVLRGYHCVKDRV